MKKKLKKTLTLIAPLSAIFPFVAISQSNATNSNIQNGMQTLPRIFTDKKPNEKITITKNFDYWNDLIPLIKQNHLDYDTSYTFNGNKILINQNEVSYLDFFTPSDPLKPDDIYEFSSSRREGNLSRRLNRYGIRQKYNVLTNGTIADKNKILAFFNSLNIKERRINNLSSEVNSLKTQISNALKSGVVENKYNYTIENVNLNFSIENWETKYRRKLSLYNSEPQSILEAGKIKELNITFTANKVFDNLEAKYGPNWESFRNFFVSQNANKITVETDTGGDINTLPDESQRSAGAVANSEKLRTYFNKLNNQTFKNSHLKIFYRNSNYIDRNSNSHLFIDVYAKDPNDLTLGEHLVYKNLKVDFTPSALLNKATIEERLKIDFGHFVDFKEGTARLVKDVPVKIEEPRITDTNGRQEIYAGKWEIHTPAQLTFTTTDAENEVLFINNQRVDVYNKQFSIPLIQLQNGKLEDGEYQVEIRQYNGQGNSEDNLVGKYTKTFVVSSLKQSIDFKWYAWDPDKNKKQQELITEYLTNEDGDVIYDEDNQPKKNPKYDPLINPKTGTKKELLWWDLSKYATLGYQTTDKSNLFTKKAASESDYLTSANGKYAQATLLPPDTFSLFKPNESQRENWNGVIVEALVLGKGGIRQTFGSLEEFKVYKMELTKIDDDYILLFAPQNNEQWEKNLPLTASEDDYFSTNGIYLFTSRAANNINSFKLVLVQENTDPSSLFSNNITTTTLAGKNFPQLTPLFKSANGIEFLDYLKAKVNDEKTITTLPYETLMEYYKTYINYLVNIHHNQAGNSEEKIDEQISDPSEKEKGTIEPTETEDPNDTRAKINLELNREYLINFAKSTTFKRFLDEIGSVSKEWFKNLSDEDYEKLDFTLTTTTLDTNLTLKIDANVKDEFIQSHKIVTKGKLELNLTSANFLTEAELIRKRGIFLDTKPFKINLHGLTEVEITNYIKELLETNISNLKLNIDYEINQKSLEEILKNLKTPQSNISDESAQVKFLKLEALNNNAGVFNIPVINTIFNLSLVSIAPLTLTNETIEKEALKEAIKNHVQTALSDYAEFFDFDDLDWNSLENTITLLYYFKEAKFNLKGQSGTNIKNSTGFNVKYTGKIIGEISQIDLKDIHFELVYDENDYAKLKLAIINDIATNIKNNYSLELNKHYLLKESEIENLIRTISSKNAVNKSKTLFIHPVTNISKNQGEVLITNNNQQEVIENLPSSEEEVKRAKERETFIIVISVLAGILTFGIAGFIIYQKKFKSKVKA